MAARPIAGLALCAGAGGLELGLRLALGPRYRAVGYVERDAFAASVLVARMADQALDPAPVWDDVATFDGHPWRGRVDLVSGGFPCQPFSDAGRRRGLDDERWLWPDIARVIEEVQPALAFFENVPPLAARGLDVVLGDLARLGFDAEWSCLSAAATGATHRRDRLWLLAYRHGGRLDVERLDSAPAREPSPGHHAYRSDRAALADTAGQPEQPVTGGARPAPSGDRAPADERAPGRGQDVADTEGRLRRPGLREGGPRPAARQLEIAEPAHGGGDVAHADGEGPQGSVHRAPRGRSGSSWRRLPLWPPGPDDHDAWWEVVELGGPQPSVRRVADGLAHRLDRLHTIGNGVVPLVAAHAFLGLAQRAGLLNGGGLT